VDVTKSLVLCQLDFGAPQLPSEQPLLLGGDIVRHGPAHGLLGPLESLPLYLLHPGLQGRYLARRLGLVARQVSCQASLQRREVGHRKRFRLPLTLNSLFNEVHRQVPLATSATTAHA